MVRPSIFQLIKIQHSLHPFLLGCYIEPKISLSEALTLRALTFNVIRFSLNVTIFEKFSKIDC